MRTPAIADPFAGPRHDHAACVTAAIARAERVCDARGARLTPIRRRVLEIVWQGHGPVGAYDILEKLSAERRRAAPPTVYRALEFLSEQGLVHRIESSNAFIGCAQPGEAHRAHFLLCAECGEGAEVDDLELREALARVARRAGFAVARETVELEGLCSKCRR
jgi:Fur family zinc uptake transcriptional regulator